MKRQVAIVCMVLTGGMLPATADENCAVREKNEAVLRQADKYLDEHPYSRSFDSYELPLYSGSLYSDQFPKVTSDAHLRRTEVDYFTAPITDTQTLRAAEEQAADMEKKGQKSLADAIRKRINEASNTVFGKRLNEREMLCISTAEKLKKSAWKLFERDNLPMAENSYRGVIEIYQKELGREIPTANAMGELARVLAAEGKRTEALQMYAQAQAIYEAFPKRTDSDSASMLEAYAELLSQQNQTQLAAKVYDEARTARRYAYAHQR